LARYEPELGEAARLALVCALIEEAGALAHRLGMPLQSLLDGAMESWGGTYGVRIGHQMHDLRQKKGGGS
jgi:hypothetical protein